VAVYGDLGCGSEPGFAPVQGRNSLTLGPLREQSHLQLLNSITVVMTE
jgi:hypothetical protein